MKIRLDEEINKLKKTLLEMGNAVEESIGLVIKALKERDTVLAKKVIRDDSLVNRLEVLVDKTCLKIFALKQPIAIDLRFVASSLKVNNDLERIGDFASRIAEEIIGISSETDTPEVSELYQMSEIVQEMVKLCLEAFMQGNVEVAKQVIQKDSEVDKLYENLIKSIGPYVHEDSERFEIGLAFINIGKSLERIGDHAKNVCEDAIYLAEGEIVKHRKDH